MLTILLSELEKEASSAILTFVPSVNSAIRTTSSTLFNAIIFVALSNDIDERVFTTTSQVSVNVISLSV